MLVAIRLAARLLCTMNPIPQKSDAELAKISIAPGRIN